MKMMYTFVEEDVAIEVLVLFRIDKRPLMIFFIKGVPIDASPGFPHVAWKILHKRRERRIIFVLYGSFVHSFIHSFITMSLALPFPFSLF